MKSDLIKELEAEIDPVRAESWAHYFGIEPNKYGEGQILLGISFTTIRKIGARYKDLNFEDLSALLKTNVHDFHFVALVILSHQYRRDPNVTKEFFCDHLAYVNNWDLVDSFAPNILGRWCFENKDESILLSLSTNGNLWYKRISLVSYLYFYRKHFLGNELEVIDALMEDKEPLIEKACGWMLREIYTKVDKHLVESYIIDNYARMSRTCLRSAIEKFPEGERGIFLRGEFK